MIEAEKSRATLLRELDAMRDGKSSMVKDLIQSRDESAEEAAILSRKWLYVYMKVRKKPRYSHVSCYIGCLCGVFIGFNGFHWISFDKSTV
jgi:hypothetical protein